MSSMSRLPPNDPRSVDWARIAGIPVSVFRFLLDSHIGRSRFGPLQPAWASSNGPQFLQRIANVGSASGESVTDPLLWLLRFRWFVGTTTLPFPNLQSRSWLSIGGTLPPRPSTNSMEYRAMAAWACRHRFLQPTDRAICQQIHRGHRHADSRGNYPFPSPAAGAWSYWLEVLSGEPCELPHTRVGSTIDHIDFWKKLPAASDAAAYLLERDAEIEAQEDAERRRIQEFIESVGKDAREHFLREKIGPEEARAPRRLERYVRPLPKQGALPLTGRNAEG